MGFFSLGCADTAKIGLSRSNMSLSRIPRMDGLKAANHWLAHLEPAKEAKRTRKFSEFQRKIEAMLAHDKGLTLAFHEGIETARWLGRVDGLREGLELNESGLRSQEDKPPPFRAVLRYAINSPK